MASKQNQPDFDATSLSANDTVTDTAAALGSVSDESFETTTSQPATFTAESSQPESPKRPLSWLNQDELMKTVDQLPQSLKDLGAKAKDLGTKAVGQVNGLTTTQKVVGGALLVSGLSWLALRGKKSKSSSDIYAPYIPKSKAGSKWKSSNESVYRGTSSGLHDTGANVPYGTYNTENGF